MVSGFVIYVLIIIYFSLLYYNKRKESYKKEEWLYSESFALAIRTT